MNNQQPIFILPESALRTQGKDAQKSNIAAARAIAETIRTTLGPKGMDKMLVDSMGDVVITNDGVTILEEMEIEHPAAKMMVEVAKTQEEEIGDGTTTAVVIAGELLKQAEELLDQNIHPSVLTRGFRLAGIKAKEVLEKIGEKININEKEILEKIAITAMTGKSAEASRHHLAELIVKAIQQVSEEKEDKIVIDLNNVKVEKRTGGSIDDSELVHGVVIDKEKVHSNMPSTVPSAKILLLDSALEVKETENDAQIRINSPEQLKNFIQQEEAMLKEMAENIKELGATVVFCQKGIDDIVQHYLAKYGIFAARRVKKSDMEQLSKATGAKIISNLKEATSKDLGNAGLVEEKKIAGESMIFISDCKNPKAVTILIRGSTEHVIDEVERAVKDALGDLSAVIESGMVVAGGGAPEMELAKELDNYAESISGREQLAVKAFSKALEIIPRTLAENAGIDPLNTIVELKSKHENGKKWEGIEVNKGKTIDMWEEGVLEPLKVKQQAITSATEVAIMILRIDDVISSKRESQPMNPQMPPQGMY